MNLSGQGLPEDLGEPTVLLWTLATLRDLRHPAAATLLGGPNPMTVRADEPAFCDLFRNNIEMKTGLEDTGRDAEGLGFLIDMIKIHALRREAALTVLARASFLGIHPSEAFGDLDAPFIISIVSD